MAKKNALAEMHAQEQVALAVAVPPVLQARIGGCQECALGFSAYVPCNQPAAFIVGWKGRRDPPIPMCEACTDHNVKNRGGEIVSKYTGKLEALPPAMVAARSVTSTAAWPLVVDGVTPADLIKEYAKNRVKLEAAAQTYKDYCAPTNERQKAIENKLLELSLQLGVDSFKTPFGTAYKTTSSRPKIADRDAYLNGCFDNWDKWGQAMLQVSAPQVDAVRDYQQEHEGVLPPGVDITSFTSMNVRKS